MAELTVSIVTPESSVAAGSAAQVTAPSSQGEVGILPGHKPLLATLQEGVVGLHDGEGAEYYAVSGGFLEVSSDRVTVLAESAEKATEINVDRADAALRDATAKLGRAAISPDEHREQTARVRRATTRLEVAKLITH
ncbi:MAG: ATP synthase F1 subunit epsilon [Myxococcota bacterium]|nr:ATP synthase F1 subunit epsilon [Myxococcota bacterium]